jgi:hypothetical protein
MIKAYPTPYRFGTKSRSGTNALVPGQIVKILSNGSVAAYADSGTAVAYGIYHGQDPDGTHIVLNGVVVGFASDTTAPSLGGPAYIVDGKTVSGNSNSGARPELGKVVAIESGRYFVYVKGLLV